MPPVHCVSFVAEASSVDMEGADFSMGELVFPLEEHEAPKTPVPFEASAAAASDTLRLLDRLLEPDTDAHSMVRLVCRMHHAKSGGCWLWRAGGGACVRLH